MESVHLADDSVSSSEKKEEQLWSMELPEQKKKRNPISFDIVEKKPETNPVAEKKIWRSDQRESPVSKDEITDRLSKMNLRTKFYFDFLEEWEVMVKVIPKRRPDVLLATSIRDPICKMLKRCFSPKELLNLRLVCKTLKQMVDPILYQTCDLWIRFIIETPSLPNFCASLSFKDKTDVFQFTKEQHRERVRSLKICGWKEYHEQLSLKEFPQLTKLETAANLLITSDQQGFDRIQKLKITSGHRDVMSKRIKYFPNLTKLSIRTKLTWDDVMKQISDLSLLKKLHIFHEESYEFTEKEMGKLFSLTHLLELRIGSVVQVKSMEEITKLTKLTHLGYSGWISPELGSTFAKMTHLKKMKIRRDTTHQSFLTNLSLQKLDMDIGEQNGNPTELKELRGTTSLKLYGSMVPTDKLCKFFLPEMKKLRLKGQFDVMSLFPSFPKSLNLLILDRTIRTEHLSHREIAAKFPNIVVRFK